MAKEDGKSISFIGGLILGSAIIFTLIYFVIKKHSAEEPIANVGISLPDYSSISLDHLITRLLSEGDGPRLKHGDRAALFLRVWIFDPNATENKGAFVYETPADKPDLFYVDNSLSNKQVGATYELLVPELWSAPGKGKLFQQVKGSILLIEMQVDRVL